MFRKQSFRIPALLLLLLALILSGCSQLSQPVDTSAIPSTSLTSLENGGVDNPNAFVDLAAFKAALLEALAAHDTEKLQLWMAEPFLTGTWRIGQSELSTADALKLLYTSELGSEIHLEVVKGADLKALMGGVDPLSLPGTDAGVTEAFLVSGWGKDGRDEAILFIGGQAADNLKWQGWMQVKGGFSGSRLGGIQPYQNDALGFSLYLPKGYEVPDSNATNGVFLAPGVGHPTENRAAAFFSIEPANGRTAEQVATQLAEKTKVEMGTGYTGANITAMNIDGNPAYAVNGLPGQDINRQLFIVHNDSLYTLMFVPDSTNAPAYSQMEDVYAMIVNTFHFTK